jgi:hypothetical protein
MRTSRVLPLAVALVFTGLACGATSTEPAPDVPALSAACDRWITDLADKGFLADVVIAPDVTPATYGPPDLSGFSASDRAIVAEGYQKACLQVATAPGSAITAAWLDACREAILARRPGDDRPAACVPPGGKREVGASCVSDYQCGSLRCGGANRRFETCGTCSPPGDAAQGSCAGGCGFGKACYGGQSVPQGGHQGPYTEGCAARAFAYDSIRTPSAGIALGESCTRTYPGDPCQDTLYCDAASSGAVGVCRARAAVGEACARDVQCIASAYCTGGSCAPRKSTGDACDVSAPAGPISDEGVGCPTGDTCWPNCGAPTVCSSHDVAPGAPGQKMFNGSCLLGFVSSPCEPCPALARDGEPCAPGQITCGPRSACVDGACLFVGPVYCK